jgi:hypothetical protein
MLKRQITLGELVGVCVTIFLVLISTYTSMKMDTKSNTERIIRLEENEQKKEVRDQRRDDEINYKLDKLDSKLDRMIEKNLKP